jgi:methyltransferase-like protein
LEENNDPVYFHQFVEGAISNGLQYIADTDIASMFAGNFAKGTADILMQASDDAVRIEQYMDFVRNRRFRSSLLCHKNVVLNKVLRPDSIGDLYVTWNLETDRDFKDIDFTKNENVTFTRKGYNFSFTTNNSIVIAALLYIIEKNTLVSVKSIITETKKRLGSKANAEAVEKVVKETLLRLVLAGMQISAFAPNYATKLSDKPKASSLARYQATYLPWVTSEKLQKVNVDLFARVMCQYLNGENDFDAIVANMVKHVVNNDLALNQDGKKVTDKKQIEANVRNMSREILEKFVPNGLLVA